MALATLQVHDFAIPHDDADDGTHDSGTCRADDDVERLLAACGCFVDVHGPGTVCARRYSDPAYMDDVAVAMLCCAGGKV
jgi:hypothetical protein